MPISKSFGKRLQADGRLTIGWVTSRIKPSQLYATLIAKASGSLQPAAAAKLLSDPEPLGGDKYQNDDSLQSLLYPSDFAPFKPNADIVVTGNGYGPGGKSVLNLNAAFRIGTLRKNLYIIGDRAWRRRLLRRAFISEPAPFVKMPLTYERALGGPRSKTNPLGRGIHSGQAPNIEFGAQTPAGPVRTKGPAGFGPIPADWAVRKRKVGTYKRKWLKERWPWFPEDFDWTYFNAAPVDQQVAGYLRGDEELEFENLHPKQPLYRSQLPALRIRCFLNERLPNGELLFREVRMNLDTLWINVGEEKMILVWRGLAPVRTLKLREIENIYAVTEPMSGPPRSLEEHYTQFLHISKEGQEAGLPDLGAAATDAAIEKELADLDAQFAGAEAEANKVFEQQKARAIAAGADPKLFQERATPQILAEAKAEFQAAMAGLKKINPDYAARLGDVDFSEFEQMEAEFAAEFPPPPTRELVQASLSAAGGMPGKLADQTLSGLDLSAMDFSGVDLSGTNLSKARLVNTSFAGANLTGANLSGADLTGADLTGALLNEADLSKTILVNAKLAGLTVAGAIFSGLDLAGMDFSGCQGKGADFSKANLAGAKFIRAKLPQADFSGAKLAGVNFQAAELPAARFNGANAISVNMESANIAGLRGGDHADFTGGNFRNSKAAGSIWEQSTLDRADFSRALLTRANFNESSLREARFDRADASKAGFDDACLQRAVLTNANLLRATFDRADLEQTNFLNSNLYGAGFWETKFHRTVIDGANVKKTLIAR